MQHTQRNMVQSAFWFVFCLVSAGQGQVNLQQLFGQGQRNLQQLLGGGQPNGQGQVNLQQLSWQGQGNALQLLGGQLSGQQARMNEPYGKFTQLEAALGERGLRMWLQHQGHGSVRSVEEFPTVKFMFWEEIRKMALLLEGGWRTVFHGRELELSEPLGVLRYTKIKFLIGLLNHVGDGYLNASDFERKKGYKYLSKLHLHQYGEVGAISLSLLKPDGEDYLWTPHGEDVVYCFRSILNRSFQDMITILQLEEHRCVYIDPKANRI